MFALAHSCPLLVSERITSRGPHIGLKERRGGGTEGGRRRARRGWEAWGGVRGSKAGLPGTHLWLKGGSRRQSRRRDKLRNFDWLGGGGGLHLRQNHSRLWIRTAAAAAAAVTPSHCNARGAVTTTSLLPPHRFMAGSPMQPQHRSVSLPPAVVELHPACSFTR